MSFINGLKIFIKKPIYVLIMGLFIAAWVLILFGYTIFTVQGYYLFLFFFIGILMGFTLLLFFISFFKQIENMSYVYIIIIFFVSIPLIIIFKGVLKSLYFPLLIGNQLLTAFFAFKLCMDSSIKVDNFFYNDEKSRGFTRPIEFIIFGIIALSGFILTWNVMRRLTPGAALRSANVFRIIFWIDFILIIIVLVRVLITKRLAAYVTLFFLLTFFYILYIFIDIIAGILFPDTLSFAWYFFIFDLVLFIYIIGSIFDKVEYLETKFKILTAETISLLVILLKLIAQFFKIIPEIPGLRVGIDYVRLQFGLQIFLLWMFIIFILIFGIHSIVMHKEGEIDTSDMDDNS
ncbi:MAG: hypothetical protein KGD58_03720 [Candidatus Lokiarchaeota archaeon]|nr:hypothetical protein [Candidatus Lokiarchaeota archaeon]